MLVIGCALGMASAFVPQIHPRAFAAHHKTPPLHMSTLSPLTGSNIVLTPDPSGFDSEKIGGACVHRYNRSDSGAEGEYLMWYHAQSNAPQEEGKPPMAPLSSGSIGLARSRNGLAWQRDPVGAFSETVPGVSMGPNEESWWGFDTAHVGLGDVMKPMSGTAVVAQGGVYIMYYFGGSFEETDVASYGAPADGKIRGMKLRIGVAISQDGRSWGRVEGEDPTGACMGPYDLEDDNYKNFLDMNAPLPDGLEEELYTGWPNVITEEGKNKGYTMFYSTMTKEKKEKCIGLGKSENGFKWYKGGIVLRPGPDDYDIKGIARGQVMKDTVYENGVWKENSKLNMLYEGVGPDNKHKICLATSADGGLSWKKEGAVFDFGAEGEWDSGGVGSPHLLRLDDGSCRMYYTGQSSDGRTAIGVVRTKGTDLKGPWEREVSEMPTFI